MSFLFAPPSETLPSIQPQSIEVESPSRLCVGFLTSQDLSNQQAKSEDAYYAATALAECHDIDLRIIGNHQQTARKSTHILPWRTPTENSTPAPKADEFSGVDLVIGFNARHQLNELLKIRDIPFLHVTDALPRSQFSISESEVSADIREIETRISARSLCNIYPSKHLARRAFEDYSVPSQKIFSVPLGVVPAPPSSNSTDKPPLDVIEILFECRDWSRDGGNLALAIATQLNASGFSCRLHVIGHLPAHLAGHPDVCVHKEVEPVSDNQHNRIRNILSAAHVSIFMRPREDASKLVSRALAHGTPILTSDTQMFPDCCAVFTIDRPAHAVNWANAIKRMCENSTSHKQICQGGFDYARQNLSWRVWARQVVSIATAQLSKPTEGSQTQNAA